MTPEASVRSANVGKQKIRTGIHLDVGHASIGWAVTTQLGGDPSTMKVAGAGSVIFPPDKCLASVRRGFRRQRRRIRSTRQRIARLAMVLQERGVLTRGQAASNACACPWLLAAGVLGGSRKLTWVELWYVLRWYAHNRGYDGNRLCLRHGGAEDAEDAKMNEAARARMAALGTRSMAETFCRMLELDPDGEGKRSSREAFKNTGMSFDREVVAEEVRRIVESHEGVLPGLDAELKRIILADPIEDADALREVAGLPIHVPKRYVGGILFGQLAPRFDNRIIGICPKTGEKLPLKSAPEFLDFRFASMLANIRLTAAGVQRALTASERGALMEAAREQGGFTKTEFKKLVRETTGAAVEETNLEALLLTPDADESLVLYPGIYELRRKKILPLLKDRLAAKHLAHTLLRGKKLSTSELKPYIQPDQMGAFQKVTQTKRGKPFSIGAKVPSGRAPYARSILKQATKAILNGEDPRATGGVLYRDATVADRVKDKDLGEKTNNHLVRHRISILQRVIKDIIHDYAENNPARIHTVTIEVAREVKEFSGKNSKDIAAAMTQLTAPHRDAAKKLAQALGIDNIRTIPAGLIRKARLALELGCRCPYTGKHYDLISVANKSLMDKDHILPHSQRQTDSLDSLVMTFTAVNRLKGNRTALQFIRDCGGQTVNGMDILDEKQYRELVDKLPLSSNKEDRQRQERRKANLLRANVADSDFTQGMLTRTSHITSLGMKAIRSIFENCRKLPNITTVPGAVTSKVRMHWKVLGALAAVDQRITADDDQDKLLPKGEIRDLNHLHHAVDAITLAIATNLLPSTIWPIICKRRLSDEDIDLLQRIGLFSINRGTREFVWNPLPEELQRSIYTALKEQRVVVHQPQNRRGLSTELNMWGIVDDAPESKTVKIHQRSRNPQFDKDPSQPKYIKKDIEVPRSKLFGLRKGGKLERLKAALCFSGNFAIAVTEPPTVMRTFKVWSQLQELREKNNGKLPALLRNGTLIQVPEGRYQGTWRVASIKDSKVGPTIDMVAPYVVGIPNKDAASRREVRVCSLMSAHMEVLKSRYTGVSLCPTTPSTSRAKA